MFGKNPQMNPLALRKQLLLAESELNRAQLAHEWQSMAQGLRAVTARAKSFSSVAFAGAVLVAGLTRFWRRKSAPVERKPAWWQTLLKGAQLGFALWSQSRPPPKSKR
jgi:hypothetical protein